MSARPETLPIAVCGECGRERKCRGVAAGRPQCNGCRGKAYKQPTATCSACGRERRCHGAKTDAPLCNTCRRRGEPKREPPVRVCSACGKHRPCLYASSDRPMCRPCAGRVPSRREPCAFCGKLAIAAARTPVGAECANCRTRRLRSKITCAVCQRTRRPSAGRPGVCERCAGERVAQTCSGCGAEDHNYCAGLCARCSLRARIEKLTRSGDPAAVAALQGYLTALVQRPDAFSTLNWTTSSRGYDTLRELISGALPLTHEALDTITDRGHTTLYLRADLVVYGALPERHEQSAAISALIDRELPALTNATDRLHLRTFATWKVLYELSRAERRGTASPNSHAHARRQILSASELLRWLAEHDLALEDLRQEHLDRWLAEGPEHRKKVRAFIRWAARRHITGPLSARPPATRRHVDPAGPGERLAQLRRLLTDNALDPRDRVAGCLIILFAQRISRLVLLAKDDVQERDGQVFLRLGNEPLLLPEPLATLTRQLRDDPPSPNATTTSSSWLFPGRRGDNLSEGYMRERLQRLGIKALPARNAAALQLGQTVPAAILADLLGFATNTTERWTQLAGGDWTRYAAARATTTTPPDKDGAGPHSASALRATAP